MSEFNKYKDKPKQLKIDGQRVVKMSELYSFLPYVWINHWYDKFDNPTILGYLFKY